MTPPPGASLQAAERLRRPGILPKGELSSWVRGGHVRKDERPEGLIRAGSGLSCEEGAAGWRTWYCPRDGTRYRAAVRCSDERTCPRCVHGWAWEEAGVAAARLEAWGRRTNWAYPSPRHVVVSFADEAAARSPADLRRGFARAWRVLDRMNVRGGALVYHAERHEGEDFYAGPHYHGLVWGRVDEDRRPRGVVVKTIKDPPEGRNVRRTLKYVLDHCHFMKGRHAVRYVGECSYRNMKAVPKGPGAPACPLCGGLMEVEGRSWEDSWRGGGPQGPSSGEVVASLLRP